MINMFLTPKEKAVRKRLRDDFPWYAEKCLVIRTKTQGVQSFVLTRTQQYIHGRLEEQLESTGRVRAIVLKGRQTKCSTLVQGRYYHRVTHRKGVRAFILTHEDAATANIFEMVDRFHQNIRSDLKPSTGKANEKELVFDILDSGYKVATARTKGAGRSGTVQYFHGSEVAFWANAYSHAAGVMQSIPDAPGTEIILESTANGIGGYFHEMWQDAVAGLNGYIAIFVPWFWEDEYRKEPPSDFVMTAEEIEYAENYGLDDDQIYWRRMKIAELRDPLLFKQEYPATPQEAFQSTGIKPFINPEAIIKARARRVPYEQQIHAPLIVGVDPAREGKDRCAIIRRQGRVLFGKKTYQKLKVPQVAYRCKEILDERDEAGAFKVTMMFIDIGYMPGVYDLLVDWGYEDRVKPVNFGGAADDPERYKNKRAEMWDRMREWLEDDTMPPDIEDDDELHADLAAPGHDRDSNFRIVLEAKKDMVKRGLRSPDVGDAAALTFTEPVELPGNADKRGRQTHADAEYNYFERVA